MCLKYETFGATYFDFRQNIVNYESTALMFHEPLVHCRNRGSSNINVYTSYRRDVYHIPRNGTNVNLLYYKYSMRVFIYTWYIQYGVCSIHATLETLPNLSTNYKAATAQDQPFPV